MRTPWFVAAAFTAAAASLSGQPSTGPAAEAVVNARRFERARMVVENSVRIGEIEMAGGNQMDANKMLGDTMHRLQQPY